MIMEKAVRQQICSKLSSSTFATLLPLIPALVLLSLLFFFPVSEPSPFLLTLPIALLSTLFLVSLTKKKRSPDENLVQGMLQKEENVTVEKHEQQSEVRSDSSFPSDSESSSSNGSIIGEKLDLRAQKHEQKKLRGIGCSSSNTMDTTISECLSIQDHQQELNPRHFGDSSLRSDCDSSSGSAMGKSLELDQNRDYQNLGISNNFASDNDNDDDDEDSLIEINLLSSDFSGFSSEENKQKMQPKLPDFLPESIFKQQDLMELLAEINEMNEDENLIEIDISSDSTKCQGLRLKRELSFLGEQYVLSD